MNPQTSAASIFVVDDDDDARTALQRLLKTYGYQTETFPSAKAFLERLPIRGEACLILDHQMPEMTGMELLEELSGSECKIPIVFLTAHGDIPTSVKAIKRGAEDFLPKLAEESELIDAIERSLNRSREINNDAQRNENLRKCAESLTQREREVCGYVVSGWSNPQIAEKLSIAERTVKAHRAKVMEKFEVDSLADLVRQTIAAGIEATD